MILRWCPPPPTHPPTTGTPPNHPYKNHQIPHLGKPPRSHGRQSPCIHTSLGQPRTALVMVLRWWATPPSPSKDRAPPPTTAPKITKIGHLGKPPHPHGRQTPSNRKRPRQPGTALVIIPRWWTTPPSPSKDRPHPPNHRSKNH
jgi:hypothetical protein